MSRASRLSGKDETAEWKGGYAPYDLVRELFIALGFVVVLTVVLAILFSSPDDKPSTIAQWARQSPLNFVTTATTELGGTSGTAGYGPPYNHNGEGQHAAFLYPQKWLGVSHPIDTAGEFVIDPLKTIPANPALGAAIAAYQAAPAKTQEAWTKAYAEGLKKLEEEMEKNPSATVVESNGSVKLPGGGYGPVPTMMNNLLALAQNGGLDGNLLTSNQFYQTDYTKPLLFMADGGLLEERAKEQHLLGDQWGMMNETGSYPGQSWLWLYTVWYQVEPFESSENADILVILLMTVLSLAFVCIPFIPGVRSIPRLIPIYRLIWREHYRSAGA
jgi:hypothetical protein